MKTAIILRFALAIHPHQSALAFADCARLSKIRDLWSGSRLAKDIRFIGQTKRLFPLENCQQVAELIAAAFPASLYLASHARLGERMGVRWTITLRKTVVLALAETVCDLDQLISTAHALPSLERDFSSCVPDLQSLGFVSGIELPDHTHGNSDADIGRFAVFAVADCFDPKQCSGIAELRIADAIKNEPPREARVDTTGERWHVDWLTGGCPDSAAQRRIAWLRQVSAG